MSGLDCQLFLRPQFVLHREHRAINHRPKHKDVHEKGHVLAHFYGDLIFSLSPQYNISRKPLSQEPSCSVLTGMELIVTFRSFFVKVSTTD
jgi:hypothetical protein